MDPPPPQAPPQTFSGKEAMTRSAAAAAAAVAATGPAATPSAKAGAIVSSSSSSSPAAAAAASANPAAPNNPARRSAPIAVQQVPSSILDDPLLRQAKSVLPSNYNFEVEKTVWRVRQSGAKVVALQLPEGLLMYALALADIVERFGRAPLSDGTETGDQAVTALVLADVTYGACCVDDLSARALGCDLLVHYGHSCLVPVGVTAVPCMYVFVDIAVDVAHLVDTVRLNFPFSAEEGAAAGAAGDEKQEGATVAAATSSTAEGSSPAGAAAPSTTGPKPVRRLALAGTIQFSGAVAAARAALLTGGGGSGSGGATDSCPAHAPYPAGSIVVPKSRPLSPGEVLGCTAPKLLPEAALPPQPKAACCGGGGCDDDNSVGGTDQKQQQQPPPVDALVFVADGRFHLEAIMIANPGVPAYRYDPYARALTRERYAHRQMRAARRRAVERARMPGARWGVILGTLGRQGNPRLMRLLQTELGRIGEEQGEGGVPPPSQPEDDDSGGAAAASPSSSPFDGPPKRPVLAATVLLSEVTPAKLQGIDHVDVWVQVACPRLSIDWGEGFLKPTLTPYEALVALGRAPAPWWDDGEEDAGAGGAGGGVSEEEGEGDDGEGDAEEKEGGAGEEAASGARLNLQPSERRAARRERRRERERQQGARPLGDYPMDYYAADGGEWSSTYHRRPARPAAAAAAVTKAR